MSSDYFELCKIDMEYQRLCLFFERAHEENRSEYVTI